MNKDSDLKEHLKIADYITQKILNKELCSGQKIPSLRQLSDLFRVNRSVAEKALVRLENQGWLIAVQGKGYFVNERSPVVKGVLSGFSTISDSMIRLGVNTYIHLNDWCLTEPTMMEREALELSSLDKVYRINTVRFIDASPMSMSTASLPEKIVPEIEQYLENFNYTSLLDIVKEHYNISPIQKYSLLESRMPLTHEAEQLGLLENMPIMWKKTLWTYPDGTPISMHVSRIRGDRFQCLIDFQKK